MSWKMILIFFRLSLCTFEVVHCLLFIACIYIASSQVFNALRQQIICLWADGIMSSIVSYWLNEKPTRVNSNVTIAWACRIPWKIALRVKQTICSSFLISSPSSKCWLWSEVSNFLGKVYNLICLSSNGPTHRFPPATICHLRLSIRSIW